jgi:hypothetical protein
MSFATEGFSAMMSFLVMVWSDPRAQPQSILICPVQQAAA